MEVHGEGLIINELKHVFVIAHVNCIEISTKEVKEGSIWQSVNLFYEILPFSCPGSYRCHDIISFKVIHMKTTTTEPIL